MRLKSFTAPSMAEAMQLVRDELGDDAIIVSTQRAAGGKGVRITAALEEVEEDQALESLFGGSGSGNRAADAVCEALKGHGVPERLVEKLGNAARASEQADPLRACVGALEAAYTFAPLPEHSAPRPFMLVGPAGSGKSMAVAKLAARSTLKQRKVGIISADNIRAGAALQLAAFTRILEIDLASARGPDSLRQLVAGMTPAFDLVFIDSPALNPFKQSDMDYLREMVEAADVEPILVLAAGGDPMEAQEIGEAFGEVGATRLLATRLDTTRRLGAILAAADAAQLMFCDVSGTPHVAHGVTAISPAFMARLIMPDAAEPAAAEPAAPPHSSDEPHWTEAVS